jgi:hypothetical protein
MKRSLFFACLVLLLLLVPAVPASTALGPVINYVSPSSWPNYSIATLTIHGSNLENVNVVRLGKCSMMSGGYSVPYFSGTIISQDSSQITANFDLTHKLPGQYEVEVQAPVQMGDEVITVIGNLSKGFTIYGFTGTTPMTTTTAIGGSATTTETTVPDTTVTPAEGENSVYFESTPADAEVWLDGNYIGKTTFTYYTNREGTYDVVLKEKGYDDYAARVTILEGKRVRFYALLSPLAGTSVNSTQTTLQATEKPATNVTTIRKSTLKIPTPLGPDPTFTEEAPVDPVIALLAAVFGLGFVVMRRR